MEEKVLMILSEMNQKFDAMDKKMDDFKQEVKEEFRALEERLEQKLEEKLDKKLDEKLEKTEASLEEKLEKKLEEKLDKKLEEKFSSYMFVFESEYGRKINIMFEELTAKNQKERIMEENMLVLQRRTDKNSAFVFSHEKRIATLERAKNKKV